MLVRTRSPAVLNQITAIPASAYRQVTLDRTGPHRTPKIADTTVRLSTYPHPIRQLVITGLGHDQPTVLITNDTTSSPKGLLERYARRMTIEQRLGEAIRAFHIDALAGAVPLNVDLDVTLSVLAHTICAALRRRLPGYHTATPTPRNAGSCPPAEPSTTRGSGGRDQTWQVQGDQVGQHQGQPGDSAELAGRELSEVRQLGAGQLFAPGRCPLGLRAWPQPGEALLGEHLGHAGAVERNPLRGQGLGDLVGRAAGPAQLDHPGPGAFLGRRGLRPWLGGHEEPPPPGPEVPHHRGQRRLGVAEAGRGLPRRGALQQVGPQCLVAALGGLGRVGEELPARARNTRPDWG
jgi:hypothetical protein